MYQRARVTTLDLRTALKITLIFMLETRIQLKKRNGALLILLSITISSSINQKDLTLPITETKYHNNSIKIPFDLINIILSSDEGLYYLNFEMVRFLESIMRIVYVVKIPYNSKFPNLKINLY